MPRHVVLKMLHYTEPEPFILSSGEFELWMAEGEITGGEMTLRWKVPVAEKNRE